MRTTLAANERLSRRLRQSFAVSVGIFLFLIGFVWYNITVAGRAYQDIYDSNRILSATQNILIDVIDMETGARGYLLTGDKSFLQPFIKGKKRFPVSLQTARDITASRPGDARTWDHIEQLHNKWLTLIEPMLNHRRPGSPDVVSLQTVASGALARRIVVDEIRSTLSTYDDRERAQFGERQREFLFLRWRNRAALAAATLFSLILTGGLSLLVYQSGRDLTQAGARLSAANLELEAINANLAAANSSLHESNELLNREVVERAVAEQRLSETVAELERSNADLEQFAYVASHDLQEPLRAIGGCVQLLKRRHGNQLDARADELIGHAVDGALRMQNLINDLLTYSRVGTRGGTPLARVDLNHILEDVLRLLRVPISESGAKIVYSDLPIVRADGSQLELVLQNLISNAIKFRAEGEPIISVSCRRQFTESVPQWVVTVADNGLGIEPQYFERIFVMFQRLHTREEFPGTGIGLAICKKIVERHGGRIWLESEVGKGTKFHFTLPVMDEGAASPEGAPAV